MASNRFTAWFAESERDEIARAARLLGSSENYVVRVAVRHYLGISDSGSTLLQVQRLLHVTGDTTETEARNGR